MSALWGLNGHRTHSGSRDGRKAIISARRCEFWFPRELVLTPEGATSGSGSLILVPNGVSPLTKGEKFSTRGVPAESRTSEKPTSCTKMLSLQARIDSFLHHSLLFIVDNRCIGNNVFHRDLLYHRRLYCVAGGNDSRN